MEPLLQMYCLLTGSLKEKNRICSLLKIYVTYTPTFNTQALLHLWTTFIALFLCIYLNDFWSLTVTQLVSFILPVSLKKVQSYLLWADLGPGPNAGMRCTLKWRLCSLEICQSFEGLAELPSFIFLHTDTHHSVDPVSDLGLPVPPSYC